MSKKSKIPYLFFIFFGVIFTMNAIMVYIALSTWTGLETRNTYIKSPKFNTILEERQRLLDLGWSFSIDARKINSHSITIKALITNKDGKPLDGFVRMSLLRPTHHGKDKSLTMTKVGDLYVVTTKLPLKGQWDVKITMNTQGEKVSSRKRFIFK